MAWQTRRGNHFKAKYTDPTAAKSEGANGFSQKGHCTTLPQEGECSCLSGMHSYSQCLRVPHTKRPPYTCAPPPCIPQEILSGALKFITSKCIRFQQDGASPHTRQSSTKKWLGKKKARVFNGGKGPAHSPDLNPSEHLWPVVSRLGPRTFGSSELHFYYAATAPSSNPYLYDCTDPLVQAPDPCTVRR